MLPVTGHALDRDTVSADSSTGDVEVRAVTGVVYTSGPGSGPRCSWNQYDQGPFESALGVAPRPPVAYDVPDEELLPEELAVRVAEREAAAEVERVRRAQPAVTQFQGAPHHVFDVRCPGVTGTLRLIPVGVTGDDLVAGLMVVAKGNIGVPVPVVSPPFEFGGWVNLGMWLAVEPAVVASITAEAGPNAWATVSPVQGSVSFDFGNGDVVECRGVGVPIVDLDTLEEGPCGYTYRLSSPEDDPYDVTVTSSWDLPYVSSSGSGSVDGFERSVSALYDVDELQTVGRSN